MPTVDLILATIRSIFDFLTEFCKMVQTPQGKQLVESWLTDKAKWDAFWLEAGNGIKNLFTGKLFQ